MTQKCKTIIIADSNEEDLASKKNALDNIYSVYAVPSIKTLFLLLESLKPDLILLDVGLSHMNGISVVGVLKRTKRTTHIPIIMLIDNLPPANEKELLAMGITDYLLKPFSQDLLLTRIENALINSNKAI